MSQFYVVNESTEDTLGASDNLYDAIQVAKKAARDGQAGDPVSILQSGGSAVRQFVLVPDGTIAEQAIAHPIKPPAPVPENRPNNPLPTGAA